MARVDKKAIVWNREAFWERFGDQHQQMLPAIERLIEADAERNVQTRLIDVTSQEEMAELDLPPVTSLVNMKQHKCAVDGIYQNLSPAYMVLLGAWDVFPCQRLDNPTKDADAMVPSDLPYASAAPYGSKIAKFRGPTRVVSRLPTKMGVSDIEYLIGLLNRAANWESRPRSDYTKFFSVSTKVWEKSTRRSLERLFGASTKLKLCPPAPPATGWRKIDMRPPIHLINCHGATCDPKYYGDSHRQTVAHRADWIRNKDLSGAVVTAECCYGAELYDVDRRAGSGEDPGICLRYLQQGAYGFWGSTNIAYGARIGNADADVMCREFLVKILDGASTGRAALETRQCFVCSQASLSPTGLKTLAQFNLLGDPSIHPVIRELDETPVVIPLSARGESEPHDMTGLGRSDRRARLTANGHYAKLGSWYAQETAKKKCPSKIESRLIQLVQDRGVSDVRVESFGVRDDLPARSAARGEREITGYYLVLGRRQPSDEEEEVLLVAEEQGENPVITREVYRR